MNTVVDEKIFELFLNYYGTGDRRVRVFVPEHKENEKLPVIYMTDGQNLFEDNHPDQFGCWYTREALRAERAQSGKAAIIVGIHNDGGHVQRGNELTPESIGELQFPDDMPADIRKLWIPEGEKFDNFVINTVMPAVEEKFPVKTGREYTAFCGSSSGGLFSFFIALNHPDKFGAAGVFSPPFVMYNNENLQTWIYSKLREKMPYLYIYSGGGDPMEQQILKSTESTYDILSQCYPPDRLNEVLLFDKPHHESAWSEIFKDFLRTFLYNC